MLLVLLLLRDSTYSWTNVSSIYRRSFLLAVQFWASCFHRIYFIVWVWIKSLHNTLNFCNRCLLHCIFLIAIFQICGGTIICRWSGRVRNSRWIHLLNWTWTWDAKSFKHTCAFWTSIRSESQRPYSIRIFSLAICHFTLQLNLFGTVSHKISNSEYSI